MIPSSCKRRAGQIRQTSASGKSETNSFQGVFAEHVGNLALNAAWLEGACQAVYPCRAEP